MKKRNNICKVGVKNSVDISAENTFIAFSGRDSGNPLYWRWGSDNSFPYALAVMSRKATAHRRIINDKTDYISGKGFAFDDRNVELEAFTVKANGLGESLRKVISKVIFDKILFGNAFLEVVTDRKGTFLSLYHQDATKCRVGKIEKGEDEIRHILLHHNWMQFTEGDAKRLPLYPVFEEQEDGTLRSIIHYKDYEPMFEHYAVPSYIAGMNVSAIAYKTDRWNISRLDNSYQMSGVMVLDSSIDSEDEAKEIIEKCEKKFAGKPGQVMFVVKNAEGSEGTKFVPVTSQNEGDWKALHEQSVSDIVVAHSWFRALSGLDYSTGLSTDRILNEYEIALNTVILPEQAEIMEPIMEVLGRVLRVDASSLQIVNRPPITQKQPYMTVWEARKADGLKYDPEDPKQQIYIADLGGKSSSNNSQKNDK